MQKAERPESDHDACKQPKREKNPLVFRDRLHISTQKPFTLSVSMQTGFVWVPFKPPIGV
jgi:hypothetical protein